MDKCNTGHEVLVVVGQVRPVPGAAAPSLHVLLWQHSMGPAAGRWALPGGEVRNDEDLATSATRQLDEKVDVRELSHLESVSEFSDPTRVPGRRVFATGFLGILPSDASTVSSKSSASSRGVYARS